MTGEDFLISSSSSELVSHPTASLRVRTFSGCLREGRPKLECGMEGGGAGGAFIGGGTRTGEAVRSLAGDCGSTRFSGESGTGGMYSLFGSSPFIIAMGEGTTLETAEVTEFRRS